MSPSDSAWEDRHYSDFDSNRNDCIDPAIDVEVEANVDVDPSIEVDPDIDKIDLAILDWFQAHSLGDGIVPNDKDILPGRAANHPGNKRLRKWVEERYKDYRNSSRLEKTIVIQEIIAMVEGRFLGKKNVHGISVWTEQTGLEIHTRIASMFRYVTKRGERKRKRDEANRRTGSHQNRNNQ